MEDSERLCSGKWGCSKRLPESEFSDSKQGLSLICRSCLRKKMLYHRYGLDADDYLRILCLQGNRCAICRSSNPGKGKDWFSVDHNHLTGEVRGLLCHICNLKVGTVDSYDPTVIRILVERALAYVASPPYMLIDKGREPPNYGYHHARQQSENGLIKCVTRFGCGKWLPRTAYMVDNWRKYGVMGECKSCHYRKWIWTRYRMLESEVELLYSSQGYCCVICTRKDSGTRRYSKMSIDHRADYVRGVLCSPCNSGIVSWLDLWDSAEVGEKANSMLEYLGC